MSTKSEEIITYHDLLNKLFKLDRLMLWKLQFLLDSNDNNDDDDDDDNDDDDDRSTAFFDMGFDNQVPPPMIEYAVVFISRG